MSKVPSLLRTCNVWRHRGSCLCKLEERTACPLGEHYIDSSCRLKFKSDPQGYLWGERQLGSRPKNLKLHKLSGHHRLFHWASIYSLGRSLRCRLSNRLPQAHQTSHGSAFKLHRTRLPTSSPSSRLHRWFRREPLRSPKLHEHRPVLEGATNLPSSARCSALQ